MNKINQIWMKMKFLHTEIALSKRHIYFIKDVESQKPQSKSVGAIGSVVCTLAW